MKKQMYYIGLLLITMFIVSCNNDYVPNPLLQVTLATDTATIFAGKPVTFNLVGNPDFMSFYSGEVGSRYEFANRNNEVGIPLFTFSSARSQGVQTDSLRLLVSTNFPGVAVTGLTGVPLNDSIVKLIHAANWTDISARVKQTTGTVSNTVAIKDTVNLSDFAQIGKTVYVAFKYTASPGSIQNKWTITGLSLTNKLADGSSYKLADMTASGTLFTIPSTAIIGVGLYNPGWKGYQVTTTPTSYAWTLGTSSFTIGGASSVGTATATIESWAIMAIDLTKVIPDFGIGLKGLDVRLPQYTNTYAKPGKYTATFVATSNNSFGKKENAQKISFTVK